jgi:uncharacterized membrane protein YdfJ with MMPL/SSD domain
LSRVKRVLAAVVVSALMLAIMAAPALAIVHASVPANECAPAEAEQAGGRPAAEAVFSNNPVFQAPPVGNASAPTPEAC